MLNSLSNIRQSVAAALLLVAAVRAADDGTALVDNAVNTIFTSHPASPSMLFVNEAVGSSRVTTLPGKNKLYELLLYPAKKVAKPLKAVVVLSGDIAGTVYLTQLKPPLGAVSVDGFVQDTNTQLHVVFDKFGDLNTGCSLHNSQPFNPYGVSHGRFGDAARDLGDLGQVRVTDNHFRVDDRSISLTGSRSVLGRKVMVQDGDGRAGCGLVGFASTAAQQY